MSAPSRSPLAPLLDEELRAAVARRELGLASRVRGNRQGPHRSRRAGAGADFLDHRAYHPGDDPRQLDWRAAARRDRLVVRRYEAEDELATTLVLDQSAGLAYPRADDPQSKAAAARSLAAAVAELAYRQSDPIAFATGGDGGVEDTFLRPRASREQANALATVLRDRRPSGVCPWTELTSRVGQGLRRPGIVVVFADLLDPDPHGDPSAALAAFFEGLWALRSRGHVVALVELLHRDELEFPWSDAEIRRFEDLKDARPAVEGSGSSMRDAYLRQLGEHLEVTTRGAEAAGLAHVRAIAGRPLAPVLIELLTRLSGARTHEAAGAAALGGSTLP